MTGSQQLILGEGAGGSGVATYIEDVFSTWLYTGTGANQTITNGIDLAGKGGLVWIKQRNSAADHNLFDSGRGIRYVLYSNSTAPQADTVFTEVSSFNAAGFSLGAFGSVNSNTNTYASWTFRKQPKFFDVVTWTGTGGSVNQTVSHNLGATPGAIFVKRTSGTANWFVYHRSVGAGAFLYLNTSDPSISSTGGFGGVSPTSTQFTVGGGVNDTVGATYVAYLFAHDAGGFGLTGTDNVITCGSFTTDGIGEATVSLGYEPQWVMMKNSQSAEGWWLTDNMRNSSLTSFGYLFANASDAEASGSGNYVMAPTATGFLAKNLNTSRTYIYIAIRRGPMKTPTTGTSVFGANLRSATTVNGTDVTAPSPLPTAGDWFWLYNRGTLNDTTSYPATWARLIGGNALSPQNTNTETGSVLNYCFGQNTIRFTSTWDGAAKNYVQYFFRRATGFFDVVCYTGNDVSARAVNHNLGVAPELVIVKARNDAANWPVYASALGNNKTLYLNLTNASATSGIWGNTTATSSYFYVGVAGDYGINNATGLNYVAYLFASCPGVSKVGSYTGTGALQTINCGFTGGARFVLIKRTDSTGDWWVYDSARGITSGNDPYLLTNSSAAEVTGTNYVDTTSVGFQVTAAAPAGLNASGGTYIFLAIA